MLSPLRFAGIITVILAVCGSARAQAIAPAGSGVKIEKMVVDNGLAHSVKYFVTGGSPRLQALVRRVEWAENELSVIEQLQGLKLDTVVNERQVAAFRTAQLTNPYYPPAFIPPALATANGCDGADGVFTSLSARRKGILTVFRVDIAAHPHVARAYDVKDDVVFVLFANGRAVKRATAPEVLERVLTKNGGLYSDERFLAEMEAFLDQK